MEEGTAHNSLSSNLVHITFNVESFLKNQLNINCDIFPSLNYLRREFFNSIGSRQTRERSVQSHCITTCYKDVE